jgi:hypothetical protein
MMGLAVETIAFGLLVSAGLLSAEPAYAGENDHGAKCSLATLRGQYLVAGTGTVFPPAFGVSEPSVSEVAGYSIYNGDGTGEDYVTQTINGVIANVTSPVPTTYKINPDCTGTKAVMNGPHFNIYVAFDGSGFAEVATAPPGFAVAGRFVRTGSQENQ